MQAPDASTAFARDLTACVQGWVQQGIVSTPNQSPHTVMEVIVLPAPTSCLAATLLPPAADTTHHGNNPLVQNAVPSSRLPDVTPTTMLQDTALCPGDPTGNSPKLSISHFQGATGRQLPSQTCHVTQPFLTLPGRQASLTQGV